MNKKDQVMKELRDVLIAKNIYSYTRSRIYNAMKNVNQINELKEVIKNNTNTYLIIRKSRNGKMESYELSDVENKRVDICIEI